jgi:hypothetical protein
MAPEKILATNLQPYPHMKSDIDNLGEWIATRRGRPIGRNDLWWLIGAVVGLVTLLAVGLWQFRSAEIRHGPIAAFYRAQPWFALAYLVLLIFLGSLSVRVWSTRHFLSIYECGISFRLKGFRSRTLRWKEIDGIASVNIADIFFGRKIKEEQQSILYPKEGRPILLNNQIEEMPLMIDGIKNQFYAYIFPQLEKDFMDGREIHFGPVIIQNESFALAKTVDPEPFLVAPYQPKRMMVFPWSKLTSLAVKSGFLVVKSENSKARYIPVSQIPNFEMLLKLVKQGVNP